MADVEVADGDVIAMLVDVLASEEEAAVDEESFEQAMPPNTVSAERPTTARVFD
jgi:hypothetical protein